MDLVEVKKDEVYTNSLVVAKKFGKEHKYVYYRIEKILKEIEEIKGQESFRLKFVKTVGSYRGQNYDMYLMNREAFSFISMRFTGKKALEWQLKFNSAFYQMEEALLKELTNKESVEWNKVRNQAIEYRKTETDVIKDFVEYATKQGSQNAKFYYSNITSMTYKCLQLIQHKKPKLRDTLDTLQLSQLVVAESIASKALKKYMEEGEHYKVIFEKVKQDLLSYANSLMLD